MAVDESSAEVTVSVDEAYLADIDVVAGRLREAGMSVDAVLREIGVVTGRIAAAEADRFAAVEGVAGVERSHGFQLAPPDADIQ